MTCPACRRPLPSGASQCPACGASLAPLTEGALAPDNHPKTEPLREIPALRKRERTWKDEVRDRVQHRRKTRGAGGLPLFDTPGRVDELEEPVGSPLPEADIPEDLPLRPSPVLDLPERAEAPRIEVEHRVEEPEEVEEDYEWPAVEERAGPVERPARLVERLSAASIDLACLGALWAITLYFAGRISHAGLIGLRPAWKYVVTDLAFVGAFYASYFTGTTGQTLGKILMGLRVVDTAGEPPGYLRALLRAILGVVGIALAFTGMIPVFFDPARRALHDRVFRTRVVKG